MYQLSPAFLGNGHQDVNLQKSKSIDGFLHYFFWKNWNMWRKCIKHIVLCFCLSSSCVLCALCCQFLWIVHFLLPLRCLFSDVYLNPWIILISNKKNITNFFKWKLVMEMYVITKSANLHVYSYLVYIGGKELPNIVFMWKSWLTLFALYFNAICRSGKYSLGK
jgi:hypothetical protein